MQLEAQIGEKQAHLERLRIEHQALTKVQFEQEQVGSNLHPTTCLWTHTAPTSLPLPLAWLGPVGEPRQSGDSTMQ